MQKKLIPLSAMRPGQSACVAELCVEGTLRRRLFDLGLIPQTHVSCRCVAPAGSPMAFVVRGTVIALRRRDAACIFGEAET